MSDALAGTLLAFDVDGTLLDPNGELAPQTIAALGAAKAAGAVLTLSTGRDWHAVTHLLDQLQSVSYALCINGIEIVTADGVELAVLALDEAVAASAIRAVRAAVPGIAVGLGIAGDLIGEPGVQSAMPAGLEDIPIVADAIDALGPELRDIVLFHPDYIDRLEELFALVQAVVPGSGIDVAYTGLPMIELVPPGAGKDQGLAWLANHLGIEQGDVVAFGDGMNDLSMLRWAGTGVSMDQARPEVHEAADERALSNAEHGVAAWITARLAEG